MKRTTLVFSLFLTVTAASPLHAQISAFTYQGRLDLNGAPANGNYDFMFRLLNDPTNGAAVPVIQINPAVLVTNGLFTTGMDFGAENFDGANCWLEINVRTNGGGPFTTLSPRQLLTPTPYAVAANTASNLLGTLPASQISGTIPNPSLPASPSFSGTVTASYFSGNGANLTNLNAATLGGLSSSNFWRTTGNNGTTAGTHFLGTADNQPLELKVNSIRAFRLESSVGNNVNVIGGWYGNSMLMGIKGATISGGGGDFFGDPYPNRVESSFSTISGGGGNTIQSNAIFTLIAGGENNSIQIQAHYAIIAGGLLNTIRSNATGATIGGGRENSIESDADFALIAGGWANKVQHNSQYAAIGGGRENLISTNAGSATIGGGFGNRIGIFALGSTISGGVGNQIRSDTYNGQIAGGTANMIESSAHYSVIAGGIYNSIQVNAESSTISGGWENIIQSNAQYAAILGGRRNSATNFALAAGNRAKANHTGAFVWADSAEVDLASSAANSLTLRASGGYWLFTDTNAMTGAFLAAGSGSWTSMSDRNAKENFHAANACEVLAKVAALPMQTWNYKSQGANIRHIGPMAQDFKAAFGLGESETGISNVDADGVALAAIQGLNQKLEESRAENAELKKRLTDLEQLVQKITPKAMQP